MRKEKISIQGIPAVLWGDKSNKLFIAVHGNLSHKEDTVIAILAEEAVSKGWRVLSFDLPEHGERRDEGIPCKVQTCVRELETAMEYAKEIAGEIALFGCSIGAYFSLLAYRSEPLRQALFLSPVVDMERIIGCGDFGLWHDTKQERHWLNWLNDKPFTTLFVDGNHENFDRLYQMPVSDWNGG